MSQYPNEKDPRSDWFYPPEKEVQEYASRDGAPTSAPPPQLPPQGCYPVEKRPQEYASRDGAPGASSSSFAPPPQGGYPVEKGPQEYASRDGAPGASSPQGYYYPPSGPPPGYGYAPQPGESTHAAAAYTGAPGPLPGPSADANNTKPGGGGLLMSLANFFGNKGTPPMWNRMAPASLPYAAFPPMCLISHGKELSRGFPELPPPCAANPHPFATHDVTEEDWKRFLSDVQHAGALSPAQRIRSSVFPAVAGMGLLSGLVATFAIERKMKYKNRSAAGDVVDHWNHYFFGPRRMEVVLCQASERLSGRFGAAPVGDPVQARMAYGLRRRAGEEYSDDDSSSSSDSCPEGGDRGLHGRHARRAARRERRAERRDRRADLREFKRERRGERRERRARGEDREPYQLFVTAI